MLLVRVRDPVNERLEVVVLAIEVDIGESVPESVVSSVDVKPPPNPPPLVMLAVGVSVINDMGAVVVTFEGA